MSDEQPDEAMADEHPMVSTPGMSVLGTVGHGKTSQVRARTMGDGSVGESF